MMSYNAGEAAVVAILLFLPIVRSAPDIPTDKSQVDSWFKNEVGVISSRKLNVESAVAGAERRSKTIRVRADGSGEFKTITDAVNSVPDNNNNRVIISIGPGNYTEKVTIDLPKPFITLYGDPNDMPTVVNSGTALQYGTTESGTLSVKSDYFCAVNLKVVNTAPRPDGKMKDAQAVAMAIFGNFASFYNCRFYGFQDTLLDDRGKHFFKDCYIEGTVDFIFGSGQSLYLNSEIHVIPGDPMAIITAHARSKADETSGYVFMHCSVTGTGGTTFLGRSWFSHARVIFASSDLSDVINPEGWSTNYGHNSTAFFGEYNNRGPGADLSKRASFTKKMTPADVKPFLSLSYIQAPMWLLPPTQLQMK